MTTNHCLDLLRRRKIVAFLGFENAPEVRDKKDSEKAINLGFSPVVARAMEKLPVKQKACLLMREMEELSYEDIAVALKLSMGSVKSNIHRAKAFLKEQLEKEYYYRATVVLALDQANKFLGRVYVWGQVRTQGPIDVAINENITAGKAILRAGGFSDFANRKKVKLVRGGSGREGTDKQVIELNMIEILEDGKTEKDVPLQPDDSIIVGSRLINF
jgi:hypothetical protein